MLKAALILFTDAFSSPHSRGRGQVRGFKINPHTLTPTLSLLQGEGVDVRAHTIGFCR
jgi:hypothetical protein